MGEPAGSIARRPVYLRALILSLPSFVTQLDGTMIMPAIPVLARHFSVDPIQFGLAVTIFFLAQAIFLPASGWAVDRFGARRCGIASLLAYLAVSAAITINDQFAWFLLLRAAAGGLAAMIIASGRTALLQSTPSALLVPVMTISTVPVLIAPTLGPALGGIFVSFWNWRVIFLLALPVGVIAAVLLQIFIPRDRTFVRRPFDWQGFLLCAATFILLLGSLESLAHDGHLPVAIAGLAAGLLLLGWTLRHIRRHAAPIVQLAPFSNRLFRTGAVGAGAAIRMSYRGLPFVLVLLLQTRLHMTPLETGFMLLAVDAGDLLMKVAVSRILERHAFGATLAVCSAASSLILVALALTVPIISPPILFAALFVLGGLRSVLFSGAGALVFIDLEKSHLNNGTIIYQVALQISNAAAVALAAMALQMRSMVGIADRPAAGIADFQYAILMLAFFAILAVGGFRKLPASAGKPPVTEQSLHP